MQLANGCRVWWYTELISQIPVVHTSNMRTYIQSQQEALFGFACMGVPLHSLAEQQGVLAVLKISKQVIPKDCCTEKSFEIKNLNVYNLTHGNMAVLVLDSPNLFTVVSINREQLISLNQKITADDITFKALLIEATCYSTVSNTDEDPLTDLHDKNSNSQ